MTPFIQAENLSKRWQENFLFKDISFTVFEGQKVALIARNGAGKSTLLDILAGINTPDEGKITLTNGVKIGYFRQTPSFNDNNTVFDEIFNTDSDELQTIKLFEEAILKNNQEEITRLSSKIDRLNAWDIEVEIKQITSQLKINLPTKKVGELSGGQQKRLGLAKVLINKPNLLILDEPTNHLDLEMIEWLEEYLMKANITLLMVTHDRYFLDRVCNEIIELEDNKIYRYLGNYSYYLKKRTERIEAEKASVAKAQNLLKTEIEWMRRMPKARTTKSKSRIDSFYDLQEKAQQKISQRSLEIGVKSARLGKKIIEIEHLYKSFPSVTLIEDFSYKFARFEKVGIVGKNGTGKSTFLNLITQQFQPDSGTIDIGQTVKFGYYKQDGINFNSGERVIDAVNKIAEQIVFEDGTRMSSTQLLTYFLFAPNVQYDYIEKLSGGEQRRLYLCTVLMQNPNFLILDEPTNDLDIVTLNILEDYLKNFGGCVIIVSHDRFFMDKIVDHLFIFEGNGIIKDFPGNYTQYRDYKKLQEAQKAQSKRVNKIAAKPEPKKPIAKTKLTYNEKKEFEQIEKEMPFIEKEMKQIESELNSGTLEHEELIEKSKRHAALKSSLDEKEMRWLELSEYV